MNNYNAIGRLTKDVDLRYTGNGTAVGTFTLAVNRSFKNANGETEADFIQCVVWKKGAETLTNYTQKGSQLGITGRIQTRHYDGNDGKRVYVTEVVVENFYFLDKKGDSVKAPEKPKPKQDNQWGEFNRNPDPFSRSGESIDISDDDLPF